MLFGRVHVWYRLRHQCSCCVLQLEARSVRAEAEAIALKATAEMRSHSSQVRTSPAGVPP